MEKKPKVPKEQKGAKAEKPKETEIGKVMHYYANISVAVVELAKGVKIGDVIRIKGHTTDFQQKIASMQMEHEKLKEARQGQSIGLKVQEPVRQNDVVYKIG